MFRQTGKYFVLLRKKFASTQKTRTFPGVCRKHKVALFKNPFIHYNERCIGMAALPILRSTGSIRCIKRIFNPTPGERAKMHIFPVLRMLRNCMRTTPSSRVLISLALLGLFLQPGCLFRKHKAPEAPKLPAPSRVAFLPLNVPQGIEDLHWIAVAAAVVNANVALAAPDIEPVPLWESIPAALQSLGVSRTVTTDIAELTASRLSARWATEGEIKSDKSTVTIRLDFIPSQAGSVPFRYEKPISPDRLEVNVETAYGQFLRYLIVRSLQVDKIKHFDAKSLKAIALAVDVEYGWFATNAKPGAAGAIVDDLARSNKDLARVLFSPTLYPVLAK
jgi:hypothetical protein